MELADREEFIQETTWPVDKIAQGFKHQICWKYFDEDDRVSEELKWGGGMIQTVVCKRAENCNCIDVLVLRDNEFLEPEWIILLERD